MDESLIDTDIFSEILRAKNAIVVENSANYLLAYGHYTLASPTLTEITSGYTKSGDVARLHAFLNLIPNLDVLPLGIDPASLAGEIIGELAKIGQPIGAYDPLIAAIAICENLTLVTGNTQHFERIVGLGFPLRLANWRNA